ncbi:hypothetical protein [Streptomyces caniscabiei]|uniref:hypothetical protein n=1 Tax=Streptomyces caniscabiei TaxID=2746961 RepID=UPI0018724C93|nr:hypothetical protein [Streptomyces caniscabiei]MBE4783964.1 hypothetical protein [Streptomyces caniscabiei]MBE4791537.1 hypothetical protein [Streptomyces caniscabiei]MDX3009226.1 hypothetical protein [Streptomyces caniscabiei]
MRRLDKGAPLRAAMKAAELDIPRLAAKTREIDPDQKGLSKSLIGFIVGGGKTAREECSDRAAELVSAALGREVTTLFEPVVFTLGESTSTRTSWTVDGRKPLPAQLMDQRALAKFLRKSPSWIDAQIADAKERGELWPGLIYVGRSRRFDPHAVLDAMRKQRTAA